MLLKRNIALNNSLLIYAKSQNVASPSQFYRKCLTKVWTHFPFDEHESTVHNSAVIYLDNHLRENFISPIN